MNIRNTRQLIWVVTLSMVLFLIYGFWPRPKKQIIPEFVIRYEITKPQEVNVVEVPIVKEIPKPPRYGFTDKEIYLLTVLLCGSAKRDGDGEYDFDFEKEINHEQVSLVLNVVMNRVNSKKFPNNVTDVIWAKNQFVYMPHWKNGLPKVSSKSYAVVEAWCKAYDMYDYSIITIPPSHLYFSGNGKYNKSSEKW